MSPGYSNAAGHANVDAAFQRHQQLVLSKLLPWVQRFGTNTHSFLSLYPGLNIFQTTEAEGYIPYVTSGNLILIAGEPVCADADLPILMRQFMEQMATPGKTIGLIPVNQAKLSLLSD